MKKLLVLPALGAAAALTYGAAAALNVNQNGAPIQVGEDVNLACAEAAEIAGWGYNDIDGNVAYAWVDITDDPAVNGSCDGNTLYVTPIDSGGNVLPDLSPPAEYSTGRAVLGTDATDSSGHVKRYKVEFGWTNKQAVVSANNLQKARIAIDQGPDVGADLP